MIVYLIFPNTPRRVAKWLACPPLMLLVVSSLHGKGHAKTIINFVQTD